MAAICDFARVCVYLSFSPRSLGFLPAFIVEAGSRIPARVGYRNIVYFPNGVRPCLARHVDGLHGPAGLRALWWALILTVGHPPSPWLGQTGDP